MNDNSLKKSRVLYIFEAGLEYLISILVSGAFLAVVTKELGISDSLTGIISAFISLGCLFQLGSLFIRRNKVKRFVIWSSILNQILFMLIYVCPIVPIPRDIRTACFVLIIFTAYFIYNLAHPKKISWFMSLVPDKERGRFTAVKEITSLIAGTVFSFVMGEISDRFRAAGNMRGMFITGAVMIFALTVFHTLTMLFSIEPDSTKVRASSLKTGVLQIKNNKNVRKLTLMFVLWNIASYSTVSFYGSYQINELELPQSVIALLVAAGSISRIVCSVPMGSYADKTGFAKMLRLCLIIVCIAFGCAAFATPSTGLICFLLYYIFHGIAMSGINSALINLVFDYVDKEYRSDALAVTQAVAGVCGFIATLCVSPMVSFVQKEGNTLFGINVYAQQVTSVIAILFTVVTILYLHFNIVKKK